MKRIINIILSFFIIIFIISCKKTSDKIDIVVSIKPIELIIREMIKDEKIYTVVKDSPHHYSPSLSDYNAIKNCKYYLYLGIPTLESEIMLEHFIKDIKDYRFYNFYKDLKIININGKDPNPHAWLSFDNSIIIAEKINNILKDYTNSESLNIFKNKVLSLKEEYKKIANKLNNYNIVQIHPAWDYIFNEIGINILTLSTGEVHNISIKEINDLINKLDNRKKTVIIISGEFKGELPSTIKNISNNIIELDPLGYKFNSYIELMEYNLKQLGDIK